MEYTEVINGRKCYVKIHSEGLLDNGRVDIGMDASLWSDIHDALMYYLLETKNTRYDLPMKDRPLITQLTFLIEEAMQEEGYGNDYMYDQLSELVP